MMHSRAKNVNMLSGPILPEMLRFGMPLLAAYLMDLAFSAADKLVAGQCAGSSALAAVSASSTAITLMLGVFNGLAIGATAVIARHIGANQLDVTEKAVHTATCLSVLFGIFITVCGVLFSDEILRLLKTPEDIFEAGGTYFRIRLFGLGMDVIYKFSAGTLRAAGETKKPLLFSVIAGILNTGLNFLLVAGFRMGVAGIAIATDVSSLTRLVCVMVFQLRTNGPCRLELRKLKLHLKSAKEIIRIGVPSGIQSSCFNLSNAFIQSAVNSLGTAAVAGGAAAVTFVSIGGSVAQTAEHAALTWTSQNFGAKQLNRMPYIFRDALLIAAAILLPFAAAFLFFGDQMVSLFLQPGDPNLSQIIRYGAVRMRLVGCFQILHATMNISAAMLRGLQKPWLPTLSVIFGSVILRILWISFVFPLHPSVEMVYICYPVTWVLTASFETCALFMLLKKYRRNPPFLPTT